MYKMNNFCIHMTYEDFVNNRMSKAWEASAFAEGERAIKLEMCPCLEGPS